MVRDSLKRGENGIEPYMANFFMLLPLPEAISLRQVERKDRGEYFLETPFAFRKGGGANIADKTRATMP